MKSPWKFEEIRAAQKMRDEGKSSRQIGIALGRTGASVKSALRMRSLTPEQREHDRTRKRKNRPPPKPKKNVGMQLSPRIHVPSELLTERAARQREMDNQTLTALLCGDPIPSRSALRKMESA